MTADTVREKFINFFRASPRSHKEISPAPLVLENDPTTLFTSSGMQPLVPYLMGELHPEGKRLVNSQPSIRTVDIDEVGDNRHLTFFEMLGNWSLGDYFKAEQLPWFLEFLTKELGLPKEKLWITVFKGSDEVPKDEESAEIWESLGFAKDKIHYYPADKNWWSRSGPPENMPPGEIGGPDSEVFFEFPNIKHNPAYGKECNPSCDCGRFVEIGNSVFIQYEKMKDGSLKELPNKNVDFGGGFERIVAVVNGTNDVYKTDLFSDAIGEIEKVSGKKYGNHREVIRIIADHIKASVFLIANDVVPSNKEHGYVLRRLLRRSIIKMRNIKGNVEKGDFAQIVSSTIKTYRGSYLSDIDDERIKGVVLEEVERFKNALERGLREVEKIKNIDAKKAFDLYQSYGFPLEITRELFLKKGQKIDKRKFEKEFEKHKNLSRAASAGKFKGGLADKSEEVTKLHTATHLLHASLRKVLGDHVQQKGSNITAERLRFDFSHKEKLSDQEIKRLNDLINKKIEEDLPVTYGTKTFKEAVDEGALAFFGEKYGEKVKVYTIGPPASGWFSREVCGGPHVSSTGKIGRVRIKKQDKIGSGLIRVYVAAE